MSYEEDKKQLAERFSREEEHPRMASEEKLQVQVTDLSSVKVGSKIDSLSCLGGAVFLTIAYLYSKDAVISTLMITAWGCYFGLSSPSFRKN